MQGKILVLHLNTILRKDLKRQLNGINKTDGFRIIHNALLIILYPMNNIYKNICVFCASSPSVSRIYIDAAYELGLLVAGIGSSCICGAGKTGLMLAVTEGVFSGGGSVIGVIPRFMVDREWHYKGLSELIVTEDMHGRKKIMSERADAVIALPGGCGTFEELMEVITWRQLDIYSNPVIILNINGFYNPLLEMFDKAVNEGFMRPSNRGLWMVATSPKEAIDLLLSWDKEKVKPAEPKY